MLGVVILLVYACLLCFPLLLLQLATPSDVPSVEPKCQAHQMQMQALEDLMLRASPYAHNYIHLCL